jgi:hypothetical protein
LRHSKELRKVSRESATGILEDIAMPEIQNELPERQSESVTLMLSSRKSPKRWGRVSMIIIQ